MPKKLVVLCDGTWNTPTQSSAGTPCPTNVVKLAVALAPHDDDGQQQLHSYREGVGNRLGERLRGGAFGMGLSREVKAAYRFLVDHYEPGDQLYFFGFSRGAFTARSTVGLVRNAGILRREHSSRVDEAFALYRRRSASPTSAAADAFRSSCSHPGTRVRCIGVWDTVGALGIPFHGNPVAAVVNRRWQFHDTALSSSVDAAFQALAVDERRRPFTPTLWTQQAHARGQRLEQVWFAGDHCDVGGGHRDAGLADISLLWMMERARECGLVFEPRGRWAAAADEHVSSARWTGAVDPDPRGGECPSQAPLLYRLARQAGDRVVGRAARGQEWLASTLVQRWEQDRDYRPGNLAQCLQDQSPGVIDVSPVQDRAGRR